MNRSSTAALLVLFAAILPLEAGTTAIAFRDVTSGSLIDFTMTSGRKPSREILEVNGGGVAVFDHDGDGDLDIFFANGATMDAPEKGPGSRLYANAGNGTFTDVTAKTGIALARWAMGVAVGDYDGDGADDLYVTCYGPDVLLRNEVRKTGRFTDVTAGAGLGDDRWSTSAAFADLDADGDLDLYVTNYVEFDVRKPPPRATFKGVEVMAGPAGLAAQGDVLYENLGQGKFRDVTRESGCATDHRLGYGLGVKIADLTRDGRPDIFVGNDSTENFLFRNLGGMKFEEVGAVSGIATNYDGHGQATMGIVLADVDGNGLPDVFTTNFSNDTDTLHLNLDGRFFEDRTSQFGLAMSTWVPLSWGTGFYDFDSDGDEDLFISSGHVYPEAATHEIDSDYLQPPELFERKGARFELQPAAGEMFRTPLSGRAAAFGDLDDDGDVDVVLTTLNDRVRIFRNDSPHADVVAVELRDRRGSRHVNGSLVELEVAGVVQRRWVGGGSFQSVDAPVAYFAVPQKGSRVARVVWPDGRKTEHAGVPLNRRITVSASTEGFEAARFAGRAARAR